MKMTARDPEMRVAMAKILLKIKQYPEAGSALGIEDASYIRSEADQKRNEVRK